MKRPLVTIAIPTYNRANAFLKEALTCAINQTYTNIEIIVSDNCSIDNTEELVNDFNDPRIKYIKQPTNIGANNNFNYCVNRARGEYLYMLLDDDVVDNDFVDVCVTAVTDHKNVGIIRTGTRILNADGKIIFERPNTAAGLSMKDLILAWFANKTTMFVCSTLFNTKRLQEIGGFQSRHELFQDVMAEVKLAANYGRIDIHDVKAGFRIHGGNMGSAARVIDWCEDSLDLLDIICYLMPGDEKLLKQEGLPFFCRMNYGYARNIESPISRYLTYIRVARIFDYSYPPARFIYQKELLPIMRAVKAFLMGKKTKAE